MKEEKNWILYLHTVPKKVTGYKYDKYYVGITGEKFERRCRKNGIGYKGRKKDGRKTYWWSAICKYGWDNIKHEIIEDGLTKEDACRKERELIAKLKSNDYEHGYNATSGGDGVHDIRCDASLREFRSKLAKERWKRDESFRNSHVGKNCHFSKYRISTKGADNPRAKEIICLNDMQIFSWCGEAAEKYNCNVDQVRNVCRGRSKGVKNKSTGEIMRWMYCSDYAKAIEKNGTQLDLDLIY